ncbi:MAG: RecX family transcriptional regulator [Deltaproteobacteria bacterium]|nr:RecX family transcriptional regulator [Deltaproteobacteria bacterium]
MKLRDASDEITDAAISRLKELGYLDDEAYSRRRVQILAEKGYGNLYIRYYLSQIGLPEDLIDIAIKTIPEGLTEERRIEMIIKKKQGMEKERLLRHLSYKGFPFETIRKVFNEEI